MIRKIGSGILDLEAVERHPDTVIDAYDTAPNKVNESRDRSCLAPILNHGNEEPRPGDSLPDGAPRVLIQWNSGSKPYGMPGIGLCRSSDTNRRHDNSPGCKPRRSAFPGQGARRPPTLRFTHQPGPGQFEARNVSVTGPSEIEASSPTCQGARSIAAGCGASRREPSSPGRHHGRARPRPLIE